MNKKDCECTAKKGKRKRLVVVGRRRQLQQIRYARITDLFFTIVLIFVVFILGLIIYAREIQSTCKKAEVLNEKSQVNITCVEFQFSTLPWYYQVM
jgi:hypothetical protein